MLNPLHAFPLRCRFLFGDVECASYDWAGLPAKHSKDPQPAQLCHNGLVEAGAVSVLYPGARNVHSFEARTAGAMLDVLIPGYTNGARRACITQESCMACRSDVQERAASLTTSCVTAQRAREGATLCCATGV